MENDMRPVRSVSVIIPTYNRALYLCEAVDSVLEQDVRDCRIEIVVIDDGSTDDTRAALARYGNRIRYVYQENRGAGPARNRGLREATGEWIAFLDSDDRWLPNKLSLQFQVLEAFPDLRAVHSNFRIFDETGTVTEQGLSFWLSDPAIKERIVWDDIYSVKRRSDDCRIPAERGVFDVYAGNIFAAQLTANCISLWTLLVHRDCVGENVRFAEDYLFNEDYWFLCRLTEGCDLVFMDVATAENRGHGGPRLTQVDYVDKFLAHIDICERIYRPSRSVYRPSTEAIDDRCRAIRVELFKKYMKDGRRHQARETYEMIRKTKGKIRDRSFFWYGIALRLPGNVIGGLIAWKRRIRQLGKGS